MLGGAASAGGGVSATRGSSVSCEKKIVSHSSRETFLSPSRSESSNSRSVGLTPCAVASCGEGYRINGAVQVMVWAVGIAKQQLHGGATAVRQGAKSISRFPAQLPQTAHAQWQKDARQSYARIVPDALRLTLWDSQRMQGRVTNHVTSSNSSSMIDS